MSTDQTPPTTLRAGAECARVLQTVIERRRSVRRYADRKLSSEQLEILLRAGINAPSGSNWQNQRFLVVEDRAEIERIGAVRFVWPYPSGDQAKLRRTHPGGILGHAAALILVFVDSKENDRRGQGEYYIWESLEIQNCAASMQNMLIQATAMGLATCWISAADAMNHTRLFSGRSWRSLLSNYAIPEYYKLQGIVAVGYPNKTDDLGFPVGEVKHGATVWQSVARKETAHYTISPKGESVGTSLPLSRSRAWRLKLYAKALKRLQRWSRSIDKRIHRIEIDRVLRDAPGPVAGGRS